MAKIDVLEDDVAVDGRNRALAIQLACGRDLFGKFSNQMDAANELVKPLEQRWQLQHLAQQPV